MNTVAKILIVVNLVLAGAFLASAANFLGQQDQWKQRYDTKTAELNGKIDTLTAQLNAANETINTQRKQTGDLQAQIAGLKTDRDKLHAENEFLNTAYTHASEQLTRATSALTASENTNKSDRDLITQLQGERQALVDQKRVALDAKEAAVRSLNDLQQQFESLMSQKQALEAKVEDLNNQLRSARFTAEAALQNPGGPEGAPMAQPAQTGQVLDVDNDANVVIISLGAEDGVRPGFRYTVSRGSKYVGMIEVTDVQARKSGAKSIKDLQQSDIQRGDRIITR